MVEDNFLPLSLGYSNLILKIEWLEKLGAVVNNWKLRLCNFNQKGALSMRRSFLGSNAYLFESHDTINQEGRGRGSIEGRRA